MRKEKGKVILFFFIIIDQISKNFALKSGSGFLNKGISFGWFSPLNNLLFSYLILLLTILTMGIVIWKFPGKLFAVFFLAGGISNLIDRIFKGGVVDFLKLPFIPFFNIADVLICLGTALFLIDFVKAKKLS